MCSTRWGSASKSRVGCLFSKQASVEPLNDDRLGQMLDVLFAANLTRPTLSTATVSRPLYCAVRLLQYLLDTTLVLPISSAPPGK